MNNKTHKIIFDDYLILSVIILAIFAIVISCISYNKNNINESTRFALISYVDSTNNRVEIEVPSSAIYYHNGSITVFMPNNEQLLIYGNFTVKTFNKQ